jgi:hypothetical protein
MERGMRHRPCAPLLFWVFVDSVANRGSTLARSPRAAPVSLHVGRCGAHEAFLETSGTAAGWKRGRGPSAFFLRHLSRLSAPRPTIRLHPMRDPANHPLARDPARTPRPSRGPMLRKIAHRGFVGSGSGALAAGHRRQSGDEDGGIGIPQKTRMAPCRASIPLPLPTRPRTRGATPACRRALTPFHCIEGHLALAGRDEQLQPDPR